MNKLQILIEAGMLGIWAIGCKQKENISELQAKVDTLRKEVAELQQMKREETAKLTVKALKNAEYDLDIGQIKLTNGSYRHGSVEEGDFWETEIEDIAFGDLNNDEREDAVVILGSSGGGSGYFYDMAAMINQNGRPYNVVTKDLGDRVNIHSITIEKGEIVLEMTVHATDDALCCPTLHKIFWYELSETKLLLKKEKFLEKVKY